MGVPYAEVIGDPIAHSKSPPIHQFWLRKLGLNGDYRATRVTAAELPAFFAARRADPYWLGCNVTIPHKEAVRSYLDALEDYEIGAVNCVLPRDGRLVGRNSDIAGLGEGLDFPVDTGRPVCLIGSGGAAKAAIAELDVIAVFQLNIVARDRDKAMKLASPYCEYGQVYAFDEAETAMADCVGVVNATPLGMTGFPAMPDSVLRGLGLVGPRGFALDLVYDPLETPFLKRARQERLRVIDGLTVLIGQARWAFEAFFGVPAPSRQDAELREWLIR